MIMVHFDKVRKVYNASQIILMRIPDQQTFRPKDQKTNKCECLPAGRQVRARVKKKE